MDAVCAHQHVDFDPLGVRQPRLDMVAQVSQGGQAVPHVHALSRKRADQRREQVSAMDLVVGEAELGF